MYRYSRYFSSLLNEINICFHQYFPTEIYKKMFVRKGISGGNNLNKHNTFFQETCNSRQSRPLPNSYQTCPLLCHKKRTWKYGKEYSIVEGGMTFMKCCESNNGVATCECCNLGNKKEMPPWDLWQEAPPGPTWHIALWVTYLLKQIACFTFARNSFSRNLIKEQEDKYDHDFILWDSIKCWVS